MYGGRRICSPTNRTGSTLFLQLCQRCRCAKMKSFRDRQECTDMLHEALLGLWAKTDREHPESGAYHPLLCHLLDVAAVADAIWLLALTPAVRRRVSANMGVSAE